MQIAQGGIAFTVLVVVVVYLKGQIKEYKKQLEEKDKAIEGLNTILREIEKENLSALFKVLGFMEKMDDKRSVGHKEVLSHIHEFRTSIEEKIKNLEKCVEKK